MSERLSGPGEIPEQRQIVDETISGLNGPITLMLGEQVFIIGQYQEFDTFRDGRTVPTTDYLLVTTEPDGSIDQAKEGADFLAIDNGDSIVLGRKHHSSRIDYSDSVSRNHARITREGSNFRIEDLGSTNGTYRLIYPSSELSSKVQRIGEVKRVPKVRLAGQSKASAGHPLSNEDAFFVGGYTPAIGAFDGVSLVAGSDVAAQLAAEASEGYLNDLPTKLPRPLALKAMHEALWAAHERIIDQRSAGNEVGNTTATVARVFQSEQGALYAGIASVGDSRAYVWREGSLQHLTLDHSFMPGVDKEWEMDVQQTLAAARSLTDMTDEERKIFDKRHFITSSLGDEARPPVVTVTDFPLQKDDMLLVTTDGIHDNLTTNEIEAILRICDDPSEAVEMLIHNASERSQDSQHDRAKRDDMTATALVYS